MVLCSRQIGPAIEPTDLVTDLKSVLDLRALLLPVLSSRHWEVAAKVRQPLGPRGGWLSKAMPRLRTLLYIDPQFSIAASLGAEPWREAIELSCRSLVEAGLGSTLVGRVVGDNLLDRLETLSEAGVEFRNDSTGLPLRELPGPIRSIHVPLGAAPYVDAVGEGCRLIIGGSASPGALAMGFLHSDSLIDRSDWNHQATTRLHAMVAEQSSLALEMMATQNLVLQRAPWSPQGEDLQSLITRGLEQLKASGGITKLPLPDVSIQSEELSLVPGPDGGVTLTQVTGKPPSNDLPVEIIYPFGYETRLVAQFTQGDRFDEVDQLANQIKELFPLTADPMGHRGVAVQVREHSEQAVRSRVLEFHILEQEKATVATMAGKVYELAAAVPGCQISTPELPEIEVSLQRWTSTIPRDQVEWDVEIRAASHWA